MSTIPSDNQLEQIILNNIGSIGQLTHENILEICVKLMQEIELCISLTGSEKKKIVIYVLTQFSIEYNCDTSLINMIPSFIDSVIAIENGTITIKQVENIAINCCFGLWNTSKNKNK